jgi:CRISPR-associated protein Csd1
MLFQALYEFAQCTRTPWADAFPNKKHLIDSPEFESRSIHWLVCLDADGRFRGFESLTGVTEFLPVPRTLEPKDSGEVAEFLIEGFETVFCLGESATEKRTPKGENKHRHFWTRIEEAANETGAPELHALLAFRRNWSPGQLPPGIAFQLFQPPKSRQGKEQWMVQTTKGDMVPLRIRPNAPATVSFRVGDQIVIQVPLILEWWCACFASWLENKKRHCNQVHGGPGICVVTGNPDAAISDSHLPKIYGVRQTSQFGGTLVSSEADAFHSYGLSTARKGKSGTQNDASYSSVSVEAAITYANSLNYLLESDEHHFNAGAFSFCFWAKQRSTGFITTLLTRPQPKEVRSFVASPFPGIPREELRKERFHSVTLTGNSSRVVVYHWLVESLDQADTNLRQWFEDLTLDTIPPTPEEDQPYPGIDDLCNATVRDPKDSNNPKEANAQIADLPAQLYRAAMEGSPVSLSLIKRVVRRLQADLVKYGNRVLETHILKDENGFYNPRLHPGIQNEFRKASQPVPPAGLARFALLKLILNRSPNKTMEIQPKLVADTGDIAYNCGRLLAVFDVLQEEAHTKRNPDGKVISKLEGAGVVERYFGTASSSPNSAFNLLWRLHVHHLKKLSGQGDKGRAAAVAIEKRITEICALFGQTESMRAMRTPPHFPRVLDLQAQGRFALGFYQQKAADAAERLANWEKNQTPNNKQ